MKKNCRLILCLATLALPSAFSQQPPPPAVPAQPPRLVPGPAPAPSPGSPSFSTRLQEIVNRASATQSPEPSLTKFNLDFTGGTPRDLVTAIEKATARPLNAIVPDEFANTRLPALKMNNVDVSQLFAALLLAGRKSEAVPSGYNSYQISQTTCGFRTDGKTSDDAIWYFFVEKPVLAPPTPPQKVCHFYSLAPYLDGGATVDDITTAIQTGWKMLGDTSPPTISFHKDTKLLIAVGESSKLEMIDAVLKALGPRATGGGGGSMPLPKLPPGAKSPEKPKSEN